MAMKFFVPGRICLFGEHSDWAGHYRRINAGVEKGYTIITGTNQGIYADVKPHPSKLILWSTTDDGKRKGPREICMDRSLLLAEAEKGGFFSYAAGVAYQVLTHYHVRGLEIDNYQTDLPIKKGLSSSAAICVLVARAFNRIYDLKMTVRGEMEYAYLGEITTPSRCGRMDQGCAYGNKPIIMVYDGEQTDVQELSVTNDFYFVIADLCASKDTMEILKKLNQCYPFAENELQLKVHEYLGPINKDINARARKMLQEGDAEGLGALMKEAQALFDEHLTPACPAELTAPVLHKVLNHGALKPYVYGGKGVGSQGDGSVQFIAKDAASQQKVIEILEKDLSMPSLKLTIGSSRKVHKAVIPAAGFGTRLFPASKALKKELFPIIDGDGKAKPVIMAIIEEAIHSGIEEICLIVQREDQALFEDFFCCPPRPENLNKLSVESRKYLNYIMELGHRISFVVQETQDGFGHAVYCAKEWVGNEPFLLMLGDHLYASENAVPCAQQLMRVYEKTRESVVGLKVTAADEIHLYGCTAGVWKDDQSILSITEFIEKPSLEDAQAHLQVEGLEEGFYLTLFGQYILKPDIFKYLEENISHNIREKGEFQLTSCLDRLRQEDGFSGYIVKGRRFDIGVPDTYRQAMMDYGNI
jgi:UTP-glucose-1-phosphate uridylyltransferase/mevalonate kinase